MIQLVCFPGPQGPHTNHQTLSAEKALSRKATSWKHHICTSTYVLTSTLIYTLIQQTQCQEALHLEHQFSSVLYRGFIVDKAGKDMPRRDQTKERREEGGWQALFPSRPREHVSTWPGPTEGRRQSPRALLQSKIHQLLSGVSITFLWTFTWHTCR